MQAGYSTRMGAAMRHAAHTLEHRQADKKLMLILTDGEPADIDVKDKKLLIQDAHKAVQELDQQMCIRDSLKGHGLDEGISTRLLVYAATLIKGGVTPRDACRMALVRPITDDADIRDTLDHAIDAIFAE